MGSGERTGGLRTTAGHRRDHRTPGGIGERREDRVQPTINHEVKY